MINLGGGPSVILGFIVSLASIGLYLTRILRPNISKDQDILFMTIGLIYSSILIIHGWRLDPILIFSQILLVSITIFFCYENLNLRSITVKKKQLKFSRQKMRPKTAFNRNEILLHKHSKIKSKKRQLPNAMKTLSNKIPNKDYIPNFLPEYREFEEKNNNIQD